MRERAGWVEMREKVGSVEMRDRVGWVEMRERVGWVEDWSPYGIYAESSFQIRYHYLCYTVIRRLLWEVWCFCSLLYG